MSAPSPALHLAVAVLLLSLVFAFPADSAARELLDVAMVLIGAVNVYFFVERVLP